MKLDDAFEIAKQIFLDATNNLDEISTEEDSKFQIISRILTECLGWAHSDIGSERKHENGFSDYLIKNDDRGALIIEAKRRGILDINVADKAKMHTLKLKGPALKKVKDGVEQAANYAQPNGIPVAVLTDGVSWTVFKTLIVGEHYTEKEAFVFPSFQAVEENFPKFFELLGKDAFESNTYRILFDELHNPRTLLSRPLVAPKKEQDIKRVAKSGISFDLDRVFDNFFSRMSGDVDPDLLVNCFVETKESRIADFSLEKMTAQVLGNLGIPEKDVGQHLTELITETVENDEGESVFIVGPTGSGKRHSWTDFSKKPSLRGCVNKCCQFA